MKKSEEPQSKPWTYVNETDVCLKAKPPEKVARERQEHFSRASAGNEAAKHTHSLVGTRKLTVRALHTLAYSSSFSQGPNFFSKELSLLQSIETLVCVCWCFILAFITLNTFLFSKWAVWCLYDPA